MSAGAGPARLQLLREEMAVAELDFVLLVNSVNVIYLAGLSGIDENLARPFFLFVPREQDPVLLVHEGRANEARAYSWIEAVQTYERLSVAPVEQIAAISSSLATPRGRIGVELGFEQRPGISPLELDRVREALQPLEMVDLAPILWRLRTIKGEAEQQALREACAITSRAYADTFAAARLGDAESDVRARMIANMALGGGESPWVAILSGRGNYDVPLGAGGSRRLVRGDMVWMDAGCAVGGLCSDFSRAGVVGGPTVEQVEAQRAVHEVTQRGVEMVRPGVAVSEIASTLNELVATLGLPATSEPSRLAGRVGHGIGLCLTEPPHLSEEDVTVLAPGMAITIEPGIATDFGMFHVEENLIVTEDGCETISSAPWQLATIAAGDDD